MSRTATIVLRRMAPICLLLVAAGVATGQQRPIVIQGGTIMTMAGKPIENGTLILENGKISAVGRQLPLPPNAEVIDARGKFVLPGLVNPHSHLGVASLPIMEGNDDGSETTGALQPQARSEDAFNTDDPVIARGVAGGVTTVQSIPGSGNNIGGWSTIVKLNGGQTLDEVKFHRAPPGMKWAWGENPKKAYGARGQPPATLMGETAILRQKFAEAQDYLAKRKAWEAGDRKSAPPERNLQLEDMVKVLEGKVRLNVHAYQVNHFEALLRIADEFHFPIASFHHALEAYKIAPELARRKIGIVTFASMWGYKVEAWNAIPQNAYLLWKNGVTVSFHTDSPVIEERYYIGQAAVATHYGLPDEAALEAVTINPARILGVDPWVGSLEPGKDADVVIWDGYPLELRSRVATVFIDGQRVYTREEGFIPWKGRPGMLLQP